MQYQIFYAKQFSRSVSEIESFESESSAQKVMKSILETIDRIEIHPEEFPLEENGNFKGCRNAIVHRTFIIYFSILSMNKTLLEGILHGKVNIY